MRQKVDSGYFGPYGGRFVPETLIHALELAKSFLIPVDVLNELWPCQGAHTLLCSSVNGQRG